MHPITTSTTHRHNHHPPFHHPNFRFPFHPILHAPAPHLRRRLLLNLRPKSEPDLTAAEQNNDSTKAPATAQEHNLTCRPRGLTSGSKNGSKLPIFSTRNTINSFQFHLLEISDGCDVAHSIAAFAARRQRSFCILRGSGAVTNVSIRQPGYSDTVVTLQGCFQILSISGSFLSSPPTPETAAGVTVFLAGGQGEVVGGSVVGELRASGIVILMAVSFHDAAFERLPAEE